MNNTDKQRILDLRGHGLKPTQISKMTDVSVNTIKSFIRRNEINDVNVCKQCGTPLLDIPKTKPKKFCCDHCRHTWWNKMKKESVHE